MSTHNDDEHRQRQRRHFTADGDAVEVREPEGADDGDGLFRIRMPVSSTQEARDGEAFTREKIDGFREQIADGDVGVFLDHGRSGPGTSRYSALGKVGYWDSAEVVDRDGGADADLVADAVLMDPAELDDDTAELRAALATLKSQAEVGVPLASSVGWSEDTGDRTVPGGADLLEISIVGIPSDPSTTTTASAEPAALARAVSAASSDFDPEAFVRAYEREANEDVGRGTVEVNGEQIDLTPPDAVQTAARLALDKDEELDTGCGTGAGDTSARQIADDDVTAERIDDIAAYLTSHEEDPTAEGPPSDWSDEEWSDCGNLQYAKWGGTSTGTGLDWAQDRANAVAEAKDEPMPYDRNLDDPEFGVDDPVMWSSNDTPVHGRVAEVGDEFEPAEGVTITGDEGEAVYLIHEYDDSLEEPQYRRENVAKPESSLSESTMDLPPTDGNFADSENSMTESESDAGDDDAGTTERGMEEKMDEVREMCRRMDERMEEMYGHMMGGGEGDGDEDDEEESADADDTERTVTVDGDEMPVGEAIDDLREQYDGTDATDLDSQTQAGGADAETTGDEDRDADDDWQFGMDAVDGLEI
jgi:hypothetical protein